jgi:hypothetical protein
MQKFHNPITQKISDFLWSIGIEVHPQTIEAETFLPGIRIVEGKIYVDETKMLSPGDILHEAGHLAIFPKETRTTLTDTVVVNENNQGGEEMAAIAWSWAALKHLEIAPEIVFHPKGYKEDSETIIENFSQKRYFGVPILAYKDMCNDVNHSEHIENTFPKMLKWTID